MNIQLQSVCSKKNIMTTCCSPSQVVSSVNLYTAWYIWWSIFKYVQINAFVSSTCWRSSDWDAGKSSLLEDDSSIMSLLGFPILTTFQTKFHQFYHVHWCFVVWPWSWLMKLIQRSVQPHLFHKKASIPPKDVSEATIRSSSSFSVPANNRAWYLRN